MGKYDFIVFNNNDKNGNSWVSIGYLNNVLRYAGFESDIKFFLKNDIDEAVEYVCKEKPIAIGLPVLQYNFYEVLNFCERIKSIKGDTFIYLGNKDGMFYSDYIMENYPSVDAIVLGEGEDTLVDMCIRLSNNQSLDGCEGLKYRSGNKIITNPLRDLEPNLEKFPFPSRDYRVSESNTFNLLGSRGCREIVLFVKPILFINTINSLL